VHCHSACGQWLLLLQRLRWSTDSFAAAVVVTPRSKNKPAGILLVVLLVAAEEAEDTKANKEAHQGGAEQHLDFGVTRP